MSGTTWLDELSLHSRDLDELDELELDDLDEQHHLAG